MSFAIRLTLTLMSTTYLSTYSAVISQLKGRVQLQQKDDIIDLCHCQAVEKEPNRIEKR